MSVKSGEDQSPADKELVSVLLELEDQILIDLLNWLYDIEPIERRETLKQLYRLSFDEVVRLAKLSPEDRKRLFDLFKPEVKVKEKRTFLSPKIVQKIEGATAKIEEMRKKLKEKTKGKQ